MTKEAGTHLPHLFFIDHALALVPWQWSCLQVLSDFPKSQKSTSYTVSNTGVFLLLPSLLPSLVFSSTATLTPEGHSCCQKVTVEVTFVGIFCDCQFFLQDAVGLYADLNGIYILTENPLAELQPECVDGCVYR